MISSQFNLREIKLIVSLRFKCYPAKIYSTKLNKGNLKSSFKCNSNETQDHIFEDYEPIKHSISYPFTLYLNTYIEVLKNNKMLSNC